MTGKLTYTGPREDRLTSATVTPEVTRAGRFSCYDLFDTVLFRKLLDPSDVFRLVYARLSDRFPELMDEMSEDGFVAARRSAERAARDGKSETTLDEIWNQMGGLIGDRHHEAVEIELSCEREVLFPNAQICGELAERRSRGEQIVFISDMYLPESFLKSVLFDLKIMRPGDRLFVSSTHNKTKQRGDLFTHVIAELGGKPSSYSMTGDNRSADVRAPRAKGLKARLYKGHRLSAYESRLNRSLGVRQRLSSTLVGSIRKGRLGPASDSNRLVTDFLGPASLLWAIWAIRRAEEEGVQRLHYMARDAYLPFLCADRLARDGHTKVTANYLYASRYGLYFSSIEDLHTDLEWIFHQTETLTPRKLAKYLRLDESDLSTPMQGLFGEFDADQRLEKPDFDLFVATLASSPDGEKVLSDARRMREAANAYFTQEGLLSGENSAFVDIGWHLNVQAALQKLIPGRRMQGLYLYLSDTRRNPSEAGRADAMMEMTVAHPRIARCPSVWYNSTVTEHLFGMVPEGTCRGFETDADGRGKPILQEISADEIAAKQGICSGVKCFAGEWGADYAHAFQSSQDCADAFRALTDEYLDHPTRESLAVIRRSMRFSTEALNHESRALVSPFQWSDLLGALALVMLRRRSNGFGWLSAKFSLAPPPLRLGNHIVRMLKPYF